VMSSQDRQVVTAIVDEDQLSLAIGRNGQNVRLASQLIGWQIDLYGSREWLEKGADLSLFGGREEDEQLEMADFPLTELDLTLTTLAALKGAGYNTFLDIIDLEREDFAQVEGLGEKEVDRILRMIDELTVVEGEAAEAARGEEGGEGAEDVESSAASGASSGAPGGEVGDDGDEDR
jgi:transcription termination/antitermination protein NusA